jgi:hypothetical protein
MIMSAIPMRACARLLDALLLQPAVLLADLAPQGWECSPLRRVFRPTPEQRTGERQRFRRNLAALRGEQTSAGPSSTAGAGD